MISKCGAFHLSVFFPGSQAPAWKPLYLKLCFTHMKRSFTMFVPKQSLGTSKNLIVQQDKIRVKCYAARSVRQTATASISVPSVSSK